MTPIVLLTFKCVKCGRKFAATSRIACYVNPYTGKPIVCPDCGSEEIVEIETLQVG
jgi:DNA-directed RNA polymerase subunit RPC12/RpoP